jgi:hypothetical protein
VSANGTELRADFRISNIGADGDANRGGFSPTVAYNSAANEYLVSWAGDGLATDDEFEIFGQRLSAGGAERGTDFRISNVGADGDKDRSAFESAVAYNSTANEYLVSWIGDGLATDDEFEIFGQRLGAGAPSAEPTSGSPRSGRTATQAAVPSNPRSPTTRRQTSIW